jgi:V/A-type H+-transporting ATPase subunit C
MTGYEYGNTRLRAMRTRLLGSVDLDMMITAGSLDRMLAILADTPYGPDIEASLVRTRGLRRLDEAVRSNLARTLRQMASFYGEDAYDKVELLLHRWDLHNLRTLVRLPQALLEPGDVSGLLVAAGRLTDAELSELAAQPDIRSRIDLMVAWHIPSSATGPSLARARAQFELDGDTSVLEEALDNAFAEAMEEVLGEQRSAPASILRAEFDARNLGTALRRRASRQDEEPGWAEVSQRYVGGGAIPIEVWEEVAATDQAEAIADLLAGRRLLPGWRSVLREWVSHGELTTLADRLRRATATAARARFSAGDPLGFDIPVAFTYSKEAEVRNLRLIGRGIVHGIPIADIEAHLEVAA